MNIIKKTAKISTLISKTNIADIIAKRELKKIEYLKKDIYHKRLFLDISAEDFKKIVQLKGERIFREGGEDIDFDIDDFNKDNLNQLYFYCIGSDKFKGNLRKGLWFWSHEFGTGKTTVLKIMNELFNDLINRHFPFFECKILAENFLKLGVLYFRKRIIWFDDIGREQKIIKEWGNEHKPIPSIIHLRDTCGAWTHASAQKPILAYNIIYGKVTTNRMIKMFNEIEFKGKSRRK